MADNISDEERNIREQDRLLPIANVGRIMKQILPSNAKISKEAKETMQECVSEFIAFVTGEASDKCRRERRKTVNGDDVTWALATLGFDTYASALKIYLQRFRDMEGDRSAAAAAAAGGNNEALQEVPPNYFSAQRNIRQGGGGGGSSGGGGGGGASSSGQHSLVPPENFN